MPPGFAWRTYRRLGARLSIGIRVVGCRRMMQCPSGRPVYLCIGALGTNVRICRVSGSRRSGAEDWGRSGKWWALPWPGPGARLTGS
jgi:hypothetical protein